MNPDGYRGTVTNGDTTAKLNGTGSVIANGKHLNGH